MPQNTRVTVSRCGTPSQRTCSQTRSQTKTRRQETHRPHTQGWRFAPDAILPGHRRAHWWVPGRTHTVQQSFTEEGRRWPETSSTRHHHNDKTKVTVTRLGYQHGSGGGLSKPQVHEATTELGDKNRRSTVRFRDVGVRWVRECGAQAQALRDNSEAPCTMSKKTVKVNPTHSTMTELKEAHRTSPTRRIRELKF